MATKVRGNSADFQPCLPLTFDHISAAGAFSVTQVDSDGAKKVRRCEDYCRSHHSSTSSVRDIPAHDSIHTDTYVSVIQRLQQAGFDARVWCQDLWAFLSGLLLQLGVLIDVWMRWVFLLARSCCYSSYITWMTRDVRTPTSAQIQVSWCSLNCVRFCACARSRARHNHRISSVSYWAYFWRCVDGVRLAPSPDRVAKVLPTIQRALAEDCLEPEVELPSETFVRAIRCISVETDSCAGCAGS